MPIGQRRFLRLVARDPFGTDLEKHAYFLPLDPSLPAEFLTHEELLRQHAAHPELATTVDEFNASEAFRKYYKLPKPREDRGGV